MDRIIRAGVSAAADDDGFAEAVTGAEFTLTANESGDGLAHMVTVKNNSGTDHSGKTLTLAGLGPMGEAQEEVITGPEGTSTVTSTRHFLRLDSVVPSATIGADTFDIGWAAESVGRWLNLQLNPVYAGQPRDFALGFGCAITEGSPDYTVEHTYDGVATFEHATVKDKTENAEGSYTAPVVAIRLKWNAAGGVRLAGIVT